MNFRWMGGLFAILVCVFVLAPAVVVVAVSFNDSTYTFFPPHGFSLRWYEAVLEQPTWRDPLITSLKLGVLTAAASTVLGLAASLALHRGRFPGRGMLSAAFLSPLVFPGILLGIALLYWFRVVGLNASFMTLFLGHILISLPYTIRLILAALPGIAREMEEAASTLGASQLNVLRTVTLPLITPALVAGFLFAFLISFDNVIISLFVGGNRTLTLPVHIFSYIEFSTDASVAAMSSLFIAVTFGVMAVLLKTGRFNALGGDS
jgi:putative spermidine/putrescine transport system permease protein